MQYDALNQSRIGTVVCVPLTSNPKWADAPGNLLLSAASTSLEKGSVANVSLIISIDKKQLTECVGKLPRCMLDRVLSGVDVELGR